MAGRTNSAGDYIHDQVVRLMLPSNVARAPDAGYVICVPNESKQKRGCEWRAVEFCATMDEVDAARRRVDLGQGTAFADMSNESLQLVRPNGQVLSDSLWSFKREVAARARMVLVRVTVLSKDDKEGTLRGYLVGDHFAVHRPMLWGDEEQATTGRIWDITHVPSKKTAATDIEGRVLAIATAVVLEDMPVPWADADPMQHLDVVLVKALKAISTSYDLADLRDIMLQRLLGC